jgi:peptidoglycan hydrolase CwlO-like protein
MTPTDERAIKKRIRDLSASLETQGKQLDEEIQEIKRMYFKLAEQTAQLKVAVAALTQRKG